MMEIHGKTVCREEEKMIEYLTSNASDLIQVLLQVCGAAAIVATLTPNTSDNTVIDFVLRALNGVAANFGKAKNA